MKIIRKAALVLALVVFFGATTAAGFAWWDRLETTENNITVPVGEGVTISVNLDDQTTGNLVPTGVIMKTGDVDEVVIDYTVSLDTIDLVNPLDLDVVISNIEIDGVDTYAGLVNIDVTAATTIQNTSETVTLKVTLTEPTTEAEYTAIANKDITFDVTFTASIQA